jgi:hypothetical protein
MYPCNKYKEKETIKLSRKNVRKNKSRKRNRISGQKCNIFIILMFLYSSIYASIHIKKSGKSEASEKNNLVRLVMQAERALLKPEQPATAGRRAPTAREQLSWR